MFGKVQSACLHGIDAQFIEVEVDIHNGLPQVIVVGLPDAAVRESVQRVRAAIKNCQFQFPMQRITVNLAPADVKKEGASFDLAIAIGILLTSGQLQQSSFQHTLLIGELALDGSLRAVNGVLAMVHRAKQAGITTVILPPDNVPEANLIDGLTVIPLKHLMQLRQDNWQRHALECYNEERTESRTPTQRAASPLLDFSDVTGQQHVKRALTIAAAGMHNILLIGPPGTGKTMLIRRLPTIMPDLTDEEALEVTKIYSVSGKLGHGQQQLIRQRPFRSPHHTITSAGLIGGGAIPKPGEVSLAHHGVLFLDELPEFSRSALEVLRQPLESAAITISRAHASYAFPTRFVLAASMNPCPCGFSGAETQRNPCTCLPYHIQRYRTKLSGPLLDRIDLHVEVPRIDYNAVTSDNEPTSSLQMKLEASRAREQQLLRYAPLASIQYNSQLIGKSLRQHCPLLPAAEQLLARSFNALGLNMRSYDRILKISRTIADLDNSDVIDIAHIAEAIQYRSLDRTALLG